MCDRMNAAAASCCVDAATVAAVEAAAVGITISARPNVLAPAASACRPSPLSCILSRREVDATRHIITCSSAPRHLAHQPLAPPAPGSIDWRAPYLCVVLVLCRSLPCSVRCRPAPPASASPPYGARTRIKSLSARALPPKQRPGCAWYMRVQGPHPWTLVLVVGGSGASAVCSAEGVTSRGPRRRK
jgi:hypothetical protein